MVLFLFELEKADKEPDRGLVLTALHSSLCPCQTCTCRNRVHRSLHEHNTQHLKSLEENVLFIAFSKNPTA